MQRERQKYYSLAAIVVAAVLFGMVIAGGLDLTPPVDADRHTQVQPVMETIAAPDFATLADRVVPSVVSVTIKDVQDPSDRNSRMPRDPFHEFFRGPQAPSDEPSVRRSAGSGFFISADGEIVTNYHVIEDADTIVIELVDGTQFECEVIGRDEATDLALIRVQKPDREFAYLALGDSEAVRVGEWVMAVGNPLDMDHTVTVGVVSAKGRVLGLSREGTSFENYIQTDAAINLGNSGGPLVNIRGEVIAINTAINARGQNLGFAVPVNILRQILPQLRENGMVVRGFLGITINNLDQDSAEAFGLSSRDGALVVEVVSRPCGRQGWCASRRHRGRHRRRAHRGYERAHRHDLGHAAGHRGRAHRHPRRQAAASSMSSSRPAMPLVNDRRAMPSRRARTTPPSASGSASAS